MQIIGQEKWQGFRGAGRGGKVTGIAAACLAVAIAGCSTSYHPGSPSKGELNNYLGAGSQTVVGTDEWTVSIDHGTNFFDALDLTLHSFVGTSPLEGDFTTSNGFYNLTANVGYKIYNVNNPNAKDSDSGVLGPAIEIPGEVAVLEAPSSGASAPFPVFAAASNSCAAIKAASNFQFLVLPNPQYVLSPLSLPPLPVYGSVQAASTANADGSVAWTFMNLTTNLFTGPAGSPVASQTGLCANSPTTVGYVVNLSDQSAVIAISPSGYMVWYAPAPPIPPSGAQTYSTLYFGMIQPTSQVDTAQLTAAKYKGLELDLGGAVGDTNHNSRPVTFSSNGGGGTGIIGGAFLNNDITQSAASDITIDLGAQDAKNNGFYPSVSITIPNATAPLPGIAIAGVPGNKHALYVAAIDGTNTLCFFLYEQ